ncbi:MAG: serine hydrolase [Clostridia bacterium]|nr:serine hydrolase [Clostridia bacterium]
MKTLTKLSTKRIYDFYRELEKYGIENHGLIIEQGGEILFEEYAYPYSADMPHTLFSVTKSIVATAAGFAIDEGLFSLDTKILPLFPEYEHCESAEWGNVTVRSVLTMQSNKEFSFLQDMTGNYAEMFMKAPFRKEKGFLYSNNDAHMVAAVIQKTSGMNLVDYLTPRLFEPLGINPPAWETNSIGECIGGTGAYLTLRDLVRICRCYADGGVYKGKQIIPEWWTKEATKRQVELPGRENEDGYGYLFWIDGDTFSMNGMFGQQITYIPKYDAVIGSLNSVVGDDMHNQLVKNFLPLAFEEESTVESDEMLRDYLENRGERIPDCGPLPPIPTGKTFYITPASDALAKFMFPASLIPRSVTSSFAKRPKKNLDCVSFELDENVLHISWFEEEDKVVVDCGLDGNSRITHCTIKGYPYTVWAYAYARKNVVHAVVKPINTLATQRITFEFSGDTMKMSMKGTPDFKKFIAGNAEQSEFYRKTNKHLRFISKGLDFALSTIEMPMKFRTR